MGVQVKEKQGKHMLLSKILPQIYNGGQFKLYNEAEFETLALTATEMDTSCCVFIDDNKFVEALKPCVSMILTTESIRKRVENQGFGICIMDNPRLAFFQIHNYLCNVDEYKPKDFVTIIEEGCRISEKAYIADKNVIIKSGTTIEEFASIKEGTVISANCIIGAGSVIGGTGFEFKRTKEGVLSVVHIGQVVIEDNVEVQYNCCIDRAIYPWDKTVIGRHSKVDNLVHIGHGAKIGSGCMIVANSGIGGRVTIGDNGWIGFAAVIRNGIIIGKNARVNMGAVVTKNVNNQESVSGNFAINHEKFMKNLKNSIEE